MSLTVKYGSRTFSLPVAASSTLGELQQDICESLKIESSAYVMLFNGEPVDGAQVFGDSQLDGATVELKKEQPAASQNDSPFRVKIRVPNAKDIVDTFKTSSTIAEIKTLKGLKGDLLFENNLVDEDATLGSLGASGLLLTLKSDDPVHNRKPARKPRVFEPTSHSHSDDEPGEPSTKQFMAYYNQIKGQSEPAMVSKKTRADMQAAQRAKIDVTVLRIRFPDQSILEGHFYNGETGADVYKFVSHYLHPPLPRYELVSIKPNFVLANDMVVSEHLGQRAMLLFKALHPWKPPYLNDKARHHMSKQAPTAAEEVAKAMHEPVEKPKKKTGIPKWLKLHK